MGGLLFAALFCHSEEGFHFGNGISVGFEFILLLTYTVINGKCEYIKMIILKWMDKIVIAKWMIIVIWSKLYIVDYACNRI